MVVCLFVQAVLAIQIESQILPSHYGTYPNLLHRNRSSYAWQGVVPEDRLLLVYILCLSVHACILGCTKIHIILLDLYDSLCFLFSKIVTWR